MKKAKKSNKKKKINLISKIIYAILLIISIILVGIVLKLNVLPLKYLIPLIIVAILVLLGIGFISLNKKFKSWVKIFINFISVILIIIFIIALYYLNTTLNFMDNIKAEEYQIESYYVLVNEDSEYEEIQDIKGKSVGIYEDSNENYSEALKELKNEVKISEKEYNDYLEVGNALIDEEVDVILLSASYKSILEDIISSFETDVKIIYTIEIKVESNIEVNKVDITKEPFNIYISGIDVYGDISSLSRSDVNMVVTVNPVTNKILLTSIPRDYYVQLHGTTGYKDKITHAGMYGVDVSIKTVEELLDQDIDYYVKVNFTTLINLVDAIGGIDIYSDTSFTSAIDRGCRYKVGNMHLNGRCALAFARERYAFIDGDRQRVKNQQKVLTAIMNKTLSSTTLITKYSKILESLGNSFQTNIPTDNVYALINKQLDSMPSWSIDTYSLNGSDKSAPTYSSGSQLLYVMEPDINTVEEAKNKINSVMAGG